MATIERELADLQEERRSLDARLGREREVIERVSSIKQEIEATRHEIEQAQRRYDYSRAAELQYGKLVGLERALKEAEAELGEMQGRGMLLKEEVGAEEVAEVVSSWTHVPVSKLLEGEIEKLLKMEERLHERVVGQDEAIRAVASAVRRAARRPAGPEPAHRQLHLPGPDRRRQDRAGPRAGRVPVRRRERR